MNIKENIRLIQVIGCIIIILGVFLVSYGDMFLKSSVSKENV